MRILIFRVKEPSCKILNVPLEVQYTSNDICSILEVYLAKIVHLAQTSILPEFVICACTFKSISFYIVILQNVTRDAIFSCVCE